MATRRETVVRCTLLGAVALSWIALSGCRQTPLRPDDVRSQFERYDRTRNRSAEPSYFDEFGKRRPNLRGRLLEQG
jgi:hypothetical protein